MASTISPTVLEFINKLGLTKKQLPSLSVIRMQCIGNFKQDLFYVATPTDSGDHPLIDSDTTVPYFQKLRDKPAVSITTWRSSDITYTALTQTRTKLRNPIMVNLDAVPKVTELNNSQRQFLGEMRGMNALFVTYNQKVEPGKLNIQASHVDGKIRLTEYSVIYEQPTQYTGSRMLSSRTAPAYISTGEGMHPYVPGTYRYPVLEVGAGEQPADNSTDYLVQALRALPVPTSSILTDLPLYVDGTQSSAPFVPGTRRFMFIFPANSTNMQTPGDMRVVTGYLAGEGNDIVQVHVTWVHDDRNGARQIITTYAGPDDVLSSTDVGFSSSLTSTKGYAINGPVDMVDEIHGTFNLLSETSSLVNSDSVSLTYIEYELDVNRVYGTVTPETFAEYLSTGYGVLPPKPASRVAEVMSSWGKVPSGFKYVLRTETCSGRSVKETTLYNTYGKKRAKACKTNNFLELQYNDEYTYKQVDNKLASLQSRDAWLWSIDNVPSATATAPAASKGEVTLSAVNENQFSAVAAGAVTGMTYPMNADGVTAFMGQFEGYTILGAEVIASILGSDGSGSTLATYNAALAEEINPEPYKMGMIDQISGYALTYQELCTVADADAEIRFLMSQVTDYANFHSGLKNVISSFKNDIVFNSMK